MLDILRAGSKLLLGPVAEFISSPLKSLTSSREDSFFRNTSPIEPDFSSTQSTFSVAEGGENSGGFLSRFVGGFVSDIPIVGPFLSPVVSRLFGSDGDRNEQNRRDNDPLADEGDTLFDTIEDFIEDPIGTGFEIATSLLTDADQNEQGPLAVQQAIVDEENEGDLEQGSGVPIDTTVDEEDSPPQQILELLDEANVLRPVANLATEAVAASVPPIASPIVRSVADRLIDAFDEANLIRSGISTIANLGSRNVDEPAEKAPEQSQNTEEKDSQPEKEDAEKNAVPNQPQESENNPLVQEQEAEPVAIVEPAEIVEPKEPETEEVEEEAPAQEPPPVQVEEPQKAEQPVVDPEPQPEPEEEEKPEETAAEEPVQEETVTIEEKVETPEVETPAVEEQKQEEAVESPPVEQTPPQVQVPEPVQEPPAPEPVEVQQPATPAAPPSGPAFYVAPNGSDNNPGTIDRPFATLEAARNAMRDNPNIDTTYIREGTYHLDETLRLDGRDNGVSFEAYPGEKPVISGGEVVRDFSYEGNGIYSAKVSEPTKFDLTIGGERQKVSQTGDWNPNDPYDTGWLIADGSTSNGSKSSFRYDGSDMSSSDVKKGMYIEVAAPGRWETHITKVSGVDYNSKTVYLESDSKFRLEDGSTYRIMGEPRHIRDEGEFAYRSSDGKLLVKPENRDTFESDGVVVPRLDEIVRIDNANDISFIGLSFQDGMSEGEAIYARNSKDITVAYSEFTNVGAAVKLSGTDYSHLVGNTLESMGRSGFEMFGGSHHNVISGNDISHVGDIIKHYGAIFSNNAAYNTISYNDISYVSRYGVSFKDSGNSSNVGNVIEYNSIKHTNQETADTGAIEFLGRTAIDTNSIIRHNYIEDTGGLGTDSNGNWKYGYQSSGIYLDDSTSGVDIYGNFIKDVGRYGIHVHGGDEVNIYNNIGILRDGSEDFVFLQDWKNQPTGKLYDTSITQNIIYSEEPSGSYVRYQRGGNPEVDDNILFNVSKYSVSSDANRDRNSIIADPRFNNPAAGDYTLADNSAAFSKGFKPLETEIGANYFNAVEILGVKLASEFEDYIV